MKNKNNILLRLYAAFESVPLPLENGGTKSASINGYISFSKDMMKIKPLMLNVLFYLRIGEEIECEENLQKLESFVGKRSVENWD